MARGGRLPGTLARAAVDLATRSQPAPNPPPNQSPIPKAALTRKLPRPNLPQNTKGQWVGEPSASFWLFRTPDGLRKTLVWLDRRYSVDGRKVEFTVSENGVSDPNEQNMRPPEVLHDTYRMRFYS